MIHRIAFRAFVAVTEDEERVKDALSIFVPMDYITTSEALGHYGNRIRILEAVLKRREGLHFFQILKEHLQPYELNRLKEEVSARTDDDCQFHLRLDKQAAFKGIVHITDSRDAIDVSAHMATYPARREEAIKLIEDLL